MGLGPSLSKAKEYSQPHSLCWAYYLVWVYLSLFQTQCVLSWSAYMVVGGVHMASGHPHYYTVLSSEGMGSTSQLPSIGCVGGIHWSSDAATEADLALFLPCVSKVSLHPGLACILFSLATLIRECMGQKCSDFYL